MSQIWTSDYLQKAVITLPDDEGRENPLTVEDLCRGVSVLGATGSGKTTASGRTIALKYLKEGWGGVVLTVKPDEADLWKGYCREAKREKDMIVFGKGAIHTKETDKDHEGQPMVFNPLDYELHRAGEGGGATQNIVNIFMNIYRMGNRIAQEGDISKEERFWDSALKRCIGKTVELLKAAEEALTMENIYGILLSVFSKDERGNAVSNDSIANCKLHFRDMPVDRNKYLQPIYYCSFCIAKAEHSLEGRHPSLSEIEYAYQWQLLDQVRDYFLQFLGTMAEKTKTIIIEMFMGLAEPFLSGILNRHFAGKNNIKPESTFAGKIIILDFPVKEYLDVGIIAQCVFKLLYQQAVERRKVDIDTKPVFLWADEAHMFVNPYDQLFLTTARGALCSTVYLTQSISNYLAVMGNGTDSKSKVDSLMGNLTTKIFHSNSDAETNEYASRLIGMHVEYMETLNVNGPLYSLNVQTTESRGGQYLPQVQPRKFTTLLTGGKRNNGLVEAVVYSMGKEWSTGKNYLETSFDQNFKL